MPLRLITPPAVAPVTVAEAKAFARVDGTDDDSLIAELLAMATEHVEQATGRQLVAATYELTLRDWPLDGIVRLPRSPLIEVVSVEYHPPAAEGVPLTLVEGTDYFVDDAAEPATIEPVRAWPRTMDRPDSVVVTFSCGYESDGGSPEDHAANIPARAKVAVKSLVSHFFEQREPTSFAAAHRIPDHLDRLLNGLRVWRLR